MLSGPAGKSGSAPVNGMWSGSVAGPAALPLVPPPDELPPLAHPVRTSAVAAPPARKPRRVSGEVEGAPVRRGEVMRRCLSTVNDGEPRAIGCRLDVGVTPEQWCDRSATTGAGSRRPATPRSDRMVHREC